MDLFVGFSALVMFALSSWNVDGSPQFGHSEPFHSYTSDENTFTQTNSAGAGNGMSMSMDNRFMPPTRTTPYNNGFGVLGGSSFNRRYPNGMDNFIPMSSNGYDHRKFRINGVKYSVRNRNGYKEYKINGHRVSEGEFNHAVSANTDRFEIDPSIADRNYPTEPPKWSTRPTTPSRPSGMQNIRN